VVKRNKNFAKLQAAYLFHEIKMRKDIVQKANPHAKIISLGVGDTTLHLFPHITHGLAEKSKSLGTQAGYSGYGDEQGMAALRQKISQVIYNGAIAPEEVFVSDGAKCDIARLQVMFGPKARVAVQDPAYPVYVDGSVIIGTTGQYDTAKQRFKGIVYMECNPENNFFPDLKKLQKVDLIYFCSPNNPTGAVATKEQLKQLVVFAKKNKSIIIFDAAYSFFIKDKKLPRSIYEIDGAKEVAIEVSSFSKPAGFTGVRLGWTVVPNELKYEDGTAVSKDWNRVMTTLFNGASNISQSGGLAALDKKGKIEMQKTVDYYLENTRLIKAALKEMGIKAFGGENAPYIWAYFPGRKSWDVFDEILTKSFVVTTPGIGFGQPGEGFLRFSGFNSRELTVEALERLKNINL
jgi:LL-diaminopimelate aminotransferase